MLQGHCLMWSATEGDFSEHGLIHISSAMVTFTADRIPNMSLPGHVIVFATQCVSEVCQPKQRERLFPFPGATITEMAHLLNKRCCGMSARPV